MNGAGLEFTIFYFVCPCTIFYSLSRIQPKIFHLPRTFISQHIISYQSYHINHIKSHHITSIISYQYQITSYHIISIISNHIISYQSYHIYNIIYHISCIIYHISYIIYHISYIIYHISYIIYHIISDQFHHPLLFGKFKIRFDNLLTKSKLKAEPLFPI